MHLQPLLRNPSRKLPNSVNYAAVIGDYAIQGYARSPILVPIERPCDFLLVINTNLAPILHRFRDIAISVKFLPKGHRWLGTQWRGNIAENFNRLSRAHERSRRQTDGRTTTHEFTFAKKSFGASILAPSGARLPTVFFDKSNTELVDMIEVTPKIIEARSDASIIFGYTIAY